jgi:hypothetical protein
MSLGSAGIGSAVEESSAAIRPRGALVLDGPSPVMVGRRGTSQEATELFDRTQRAGGVLALREVRKPGTGVADLRSLAAELVHFGLAMVTERRGRAGTTDPVVTLVDEFKGRLLIPGEGSGWRRWA